MTTKGRNFRLEDGGLEELLESRLMRSSSSFTRSSNWVMTAWHSSNVCGNCAAARAGDSTRVALAGFVCTSQVSQSNQELAMFNSSYTADLPPATANRGPRTT